MKIIDLGQRLKEKYKRKSLCITPSVPVGSGKESVSKFRKLQEGGGGGGRLLIFGFFLVVFVAKTLRELHNFVFIIIMCLYFFSF